MHSCNKGCRKTAFITDILGMNNKHEELNRSILHSPKVYIVLVNWNGWKDTVECLESIYRSDYKNYRIVIVDNGSDDDSLRYIKSWLNNELCTWSSFSNTLRKYSIPPISKKIPYISYTIEEAALGGNQEPEASLASDFPQRNAYPLIIIESKINLGFGKGNNVALRYILAKKDYDYVWLLNNDTVIEPTSLSLMIDVERNSAVIVGSILKYYYSPSKVQAYGGGYLSTLTGIVKTENKKIPNYLNHINGASFMIDKYVLSEIGLFDENIFMYFEETEYCMRAIKQNVSFFMSNAVVYHKGGASSGNTDRDFAWINVYKNKFYSFMKNNGLGLWLVFYWGVLIINVINPKIDSNKRRVSNDILSYHLGEWLKVLINRLGGKDEEK